jgi:two-component system, OmpR family, alkaline phosphatase synthesis response regulator PhoP
MEAASGRYEVACHRCQGAFDALQAAWCSCLVTERSLVCPKCRACFCQAPAPYKNGFWSRAPRSLWDRKFAEHRSDFVPQPNPEPADVVRPLVLVVDDEKDILRVATLTIEALGYGVVHAGNGEEGLALVRKYRPDLVLADALMPRLDGRDMCRLIRDDPDVFATPVVVMTSLYTAVKYQTEGYTQFRVTDYLAKPLDTDRLRALLQKHLGG